MLCHCLGTHFGFVADSYTKLFYDETKKKSMYIYYKNNIVTKIFFTLCSNYNR